MLDSAQWAQPASFHVKLPVLSSTTIVPAQPEWHGCAFDACQRYRGLSYAHEEQEALSSQDRPSPAGFGSFENRGAELPGDFDPTHLTFFPIA